MKISRAFLPPDPMLPRLSRLPMALACLLALSSCATFDKDGKKNLVTLDSAVPDYQLRPAIIDVLGSHGLRAIHPDGNPLRFECPATRAELIAYKNLGPFEQELIESAQIEMVPASTGTRIHARVQILHNPGTMFEDSKYPLIGTRLRYEKMLKQAMAEAGDSTHAKVRAAPVEYTVPLPLDGL